MTRVRIGALRRLNRAKWRESVKPGLTLAGRAKWRPLGAELRRESGYPPPLDGAPSAAHCPARMNGLFAIGGICRIIIS